MCREFTSIKLLRGFTEVMDNISIVNTSKNQERPPTFIGLYQADFCKYILSFCESLLGSI